MGEIYKHKVEKLSENYYWFTAITKKKEIANELFCFEFTLSERSDKKRDYLKC